MGYVGFLYWKFVDCSMFSVNNCTNSTFEYEIGIKLNDTILSYFENLDVATNIPNHLV